MTLGYVARGLVQALTVYALASSVVAIAVGLTWRRVAGWPAPAAVAARRLFLLRLAPSLAGACAVLLVVAGYARWETHVEIERVGRLALVSAAAGLALLVSGVWRAARVARRTVRIRQALVLASRTRLLTVPIPAYIVDSRFPVVALVGLVMTRLFVARRVIDACTGDEFDAVIAHEQAHARTRDNLRRLAMTAAPDGLGLLPAGERMQQAWLRAAELAADQWAAEQTDGVHLAAALVKVARLATMQPEPLPASALYRGEPIAERVHRLLEPAKSVPPPRPWPRWAGAAAYAAAVAAALIALPAVHSAAEQILKWGL
jgi:Zn-dependent protease with chaperone function